MHQAKTIRGNNHEPVVAVARPWLEARSAFPPPASSVGVIMASPVILTVTSGFGIGGDTFALAMLIAFIMMQAQLTTFSEAAALLPTSGSVYDYISCGMGRFSPSPARCRPT